MGKYNIGDWVWYSGLEHYSTWIQCPECFGKKYIRVILGDDSEVTIDCAGCSGGMVPPRGVIEMYGWRATPELVEIVGLSATAEKTEYHIKTNYCVAESSLFLSEPEAAVRCEELIKEMVEQQTERVKSKQNNYRTWAWNAHYYRDVIRRAEKDIVYYTAKLNVANQHKKEGKP